jgi:hypothetical protein
MRVIEILCFILLFASCTEKKNKLAEEKKAISLSGLWIPETIKWGGDDIKSKDTGDVFRIADFLTLNFQNDGRFVFFGSTQRKPLHYNDSIIFAGEPIVNVFGGEWSYVDDTTLAVYYKPLEWQISPPDLGEKKEHIKIRVLAKDTSLVFENTVYHRTVKYDRVSKIEIEKFLQKYSD